MRIRTMVLCAVLTAAVWGTGNCSVFNRNADLVLGQQNFTAEQINTIDSWGLNEPQGIASDNATGRIYIADTTNSRVLWWNNADSHSNGAPADGVVGQINMTSRLANRGGSRNAGGLSYPKGIAVDSAGNLWVADTSNGRVLKFSRPVSNGENAVLVLGKANFNTDYNIYDEPEKNLYFPQGVFVDGSNNLWVADTDSSRVVRFSNPSQNGAAADLVLGQEGFASEWGNRGLGMSGANTLNQPKAVTTDGAGNVYVADSGNYRVLKFDFSVSTFNAVAVWGQASFNASSPNQGRGWSSIAADTLSGPYGIALDGLGGLYVSDQRTSRIVKYSLAGSTCNAVMALGQPSLTSNDYDDVPSSKTLETPYQVAVDASGNIWVCDNYNSRAVRYPAGALATGAAADKVLGQPVFTSDQKNAVGAGGLNQPYDVAVDTRTGRVYASDFLNNRVIWWNNPASLTNGAAADGVIGQADMRSGAVNRGGDAAAGTLNGPIGIFVDASGNLWVADEYNNRVLRFPNPVETGTVADVVLGQASFTAGGGSSGANRLSCPFDVAVDSAGNVWVVDCVNQRVLRYNYPQSSTNDSADLVLGQADFDAHSSNRGGAVTAGGLNFPRGLAFDASGDLWVADDNNNRVLGYKYPFSSGEDADKVIGQVNFAIGALNRGGSVRANSMYAPFDVAFDRSGTLWVSENGNRRVLGFSLDRSSSTALFLLGQGGYNYAGYSGTGLSTIPYPRGIETDADGNLWVADMWTNRILKFNTLSISSCEPSAGYNHRFEKGLLRGREFPALGTMKLTKQGEQDITASATVHDSGKLSFTAGLMGKTTGMWNIVLSTGYLNTSFSITYPYEIRSSTSAKVCAVSCVTGGTLSHTLDWGSITVDVPGGAFSSDILMSVSDAPAADGTSRTMNPTGIALEIQNSINAQPQRDITISIAYNRSGIGQVDEKRLYIARYDEDRRVWLLLPSTVDTARGVITCRTSHLSKFAVIELVAQSDLNNLITYPNPYKPGSGTAYDNTLLGKGIIFSGLTERARIRIFTVTGELVRDMETSGAIALWDAKNDSGNNAASGVYVYLVTNSDNPSHKAQGKLAIIK